MNFEQFRNLDPNNIGSWPLVAKIVVVLLVCAVVLGGGYHFDTRNLIAKLDQVEAQEDQLRQTFSAKAQKAASLELLKRQLEEIKVAFGEQLRLLPNKTEIEGLLVDISQAGLAAGLEFDLFKPAQEQPVEFYAVQPINIRVNGQYHQFGEFVSSVASLPRIVTQHNIIISEAPAGPKGESGGLIMDMVAKTYRYLEQDEIQGQ